MLEALNIRFYLNFYAIPIIIVAILTFLTGLYIYFQNKKSIVNLSFFLLCIAINLWLFGQAAVYSSRDPDLALMIYRGITFLGVVLISPLVYLFSAVWLGLYEKKKWIVKAGFAGAAFFYLSGLFTQESFPAVTRYFWGFYPVYGFYNYFFLVFFFSYFFAAFYNFIRGYQGETQTLRLAQIKLITIAFIVSFLSSFDYLPKLVHFELYPLGFLYVFSWILIVAYAIIKYKAMDIETVIHKTLMWFTSTLIAVFPFAILIYLSQAWLREVSFFAATSFYLTVILAFYFYFRAVQPRLNHLFRRKRANLENVFREFSSELVHLKNLRDLLQHFSRLLRRTVYTRRLSIYFRDESEEQFVPAIAKGLRGLPPAPADDPFLAWLEKQDKVIVGDLAQSDPALQNLKGYVNAYFSQMQATVVVPFVLSGKLIGILHLGKKENLRKYSAPEIDFLSQLKSSITIAFSNSRQYENVSHLYQQVQLQNERLKELDRLKSEFLANTSHELRTPLHGILGLVESIIDGADGPVNNVQEKHLRMIIESGTNLKEMINNLLELSKMEAGQSRLNVKAFNIINVVDAVMGLMESLAQKKRIRLERVAPESLSDVYGDPEKIQRVLVNLVGNAIKFTEQGSVVVRIAEDADEVHISVEDTGVGISPEDQKIIFERFRQADGSTTRRFEGTGLGLSIAQEIMRLHQSGIRVGSEPGRGSIFSFSLSRKPLLDTAEAPDEAPRVKKTIGEPIPAVPAASPGSVYGADKEYDLEKDEEFNRAVLGCGEKILVIDDNPINREVVKTRLQMIRYQVIEAVDGIDGLEKIEGEKPDLVILDLMMPRMSGYEFCKRLRQKYSHDEVPVIMLTAKTAMGDKIYGLHVGANDYIAKPFNKEELIARVGILLKIRQMAQELRKWNAELEKRVDERTRELVKTQEQLIQAEKLATLGTLAGGVAHEINNPLTAVLTNAQILKMTAGQEDRESIELIEEGAKRCQLIVQKLMKYARKSPVETLNERVDLRKVIENVTSMLAYQLRQENIELKMDFQSLPFIEGVANELEQVFTNLILNARDAIKAAKREDGEIRIQASQNRSREALEVTVQDNGTGIEKKHLNKIFDPFFTTKDVGEGTGLGLAVSLGIIKKHRAEIRIQTKEGAGTAFTIEFPLAGQPQAGKTFPQKAANSMKIKPAL